MTNVFNGPAISGGLVRRWFVVLADLSYMVPGSLDVNSCGETISNQGSLFGRPVGNGVISCGSFAGSSGTSIQYQPSSLQESLLALGARIGLRIPLRSVAFQVGSGLHLLDWNVTSVTYTAQFPPGTVGTMSASSRPTGGSNVHASVPAWLAFEFKPWCDWVGNLSVGAELPTADDGNGTFQPSFVSSIQFGYQPSSTCRANQ
jgi:hypothetical protein